MTDTTLSEGAQTALSTVPAFRIEEDARILPCMAELADEPNVRIFVPSPPFAWGEVVAFFVGPDRERNAALLIAVPDLLAALRAQQAAIDHDESGCPMCLCGQCGSCVTCCELEERANTLRLAALARVAGEPSR